MDINISAIEKGDWLTDDHIYAASSILKMQFPDVAGFQDTIKWQNKPFKCIDCPYVQIVHTNANHWITIPTCPM